MLFSHTLNLCLLINKLRPKMLAGIWFFEEIATCISDLFLLFEIFGERTIFQNGYKQKTSSEIQNWLS